MFNKTDIGNFTEDLKKLKAQAEEVVGKGVKNLDDTELYRHITDLFDASGGKIMRKKELFELRDFLWTKYKVRVRFVDTDYKLINQKNIIYQGKKISKLEYWNIRKTLGSFSEGPPPEMFLRLGQNKSLNAGLEGTSELTVFHEMVHLKYWADKGVKINKWQEEVIVFDEIWKTKNRWTDREILDSYYYVVDGLERTKLNGDLKNFISKYKSEIEKIQTKIFEQ